MPTPRYNKYNPGKTKGFHPINSGMNSSNHPVITSLAKCEHPPKTKFSQQSWQFDRLSNTLKCNEQDAVRMALYEALEAPGRHETAFRYGSWNEERPSGAILEGAGGTKGTDCSTTDTITTSKIQNLYDFRSSGCIMESDETRSQAENCRIVSGDDVLTNGVETTGKPPSEDRSTETGATRAQMLFDYLDEIKEEERNAERRKIQYHGVLEHK